MDVSGRDIIGMSRELLSNIQTRLPELEKLFDKMNSHWHYEDPIYRFYHQSFKVYGIQGRTKEIVDALRSVAPNGAELCDYFGEIYRDGVRGEQFKREHNQNWTAHTRRFVEAFFHARYFLEMAVKYGRELKESPNLLPSGWAALLCLYGIR
jgi:hypothetical protein